MSFPRARCAGTTLIYHWFTEKRNIPLTDGTLSTIHKKIPSSCTRYIDNDRFEKMLLLLHTRINFFTTNYYIQINL